MAIGLLSITLGAHLILQNSHSDLCVPWASAKALEQGYTEPQTFVHISDTLSSFIQWLLNVICTQENFKMPLPNASLFPMNDKHIGWQYALTQTFLFTGKAAENGRLVSFNEIWIQEVYMLTSLLNASVCLSLYLCQFKLTSLAVRFS